MRLAVTLSVTLMSSATFAQTLTQPPAPWASFDPTPPDASAAPTAPTSPSRPMRWPTIAPAAPRAPAFTPVLQGPRDAGEPGADHFFQLPTARTLRLGDLMGHYISHLGWVGLRYGLTRSIDVGVGLPYYFVGVSADVRVAFVQRRGLALSWWGYVTVPFKPDGENPSSNLGFTWAYGGMGWLTGPLVSVWGDRVGVHLGIHGAQRTGLGGLWLFTHATVDVRIVEGIKAIAQGIVLYELAEENADRARSLLGNGTPRVLPYALGGVRFYTRRFAADVGVLVPLSEHAPLFSDSLAVLPWMSLSHLF